MKRVVHEHAVRMAEAAQARIVELEAKIVGLEKDLNHLWDTVPGYIDQGRTQAAIQIPQLRARNIVLEVEIARSMRLLKQLGYDPVTGHMRKQG